MENQGVQPHKSRIAGWLSGGVVGGIAGLFPGAACCIGYGLGGVLGVLVARAILGEIRFSDGVKTGIVSGLIGPLFGAMGGIAFFKWAEKLPTYNAPPDNEAMMTILYALIVFAALVGFALSIGGAILAVFLLNFREKDQWQSERG